MAVPSSWELVPSAHSVLAYGRIISCINNDLIYCQDGVTIFLGTNSLNTLRAGSLILDGDFIVIGIFVKVLFIYLFKE